jgi:hypothetical protein
MTKFAQWLKSLYTHPSPEVMAMRELDSAKRGLLEAQSAREWATASCQYHEARVKRLTAYLHKATEAEA